MAPHGHVRGELAVGAVDGHHRYLVVAPDGRLAYGQGLQLFGIGERVAVAAGYGCGAAIRRHVGLLDFRVASRQRERCGYDAGRGCEHHLLVHSVPLRQERAGGRTRTPCRPAHAFGASRQPFSVEPYHTSSQKFRAPLIESARSLSSRMSSQADEAMAAGLQVAGHRAREGGLACAKSARWGEAAASTGSCGRDQSSWHDSRAESCGRVFATRHFSEAARARALDTSHRLRSRPCANGSWYCQAFEGPAGFRPERRAGGCNRQARPAPSALRLPAAARAPRPVRTPLPRFPTPGPVRARRAPA